MKVERPVGFAVFWKLAVVLVAAVALGACSSGGGSGGSAVSVGSDGERASSEDSPGGMSLPDSAASPEFAQSDAALPESAADVPSDTERKVIQTADLGLVSGDVRETASGVQDVAARYEGTVLESRVERGDGGVSASLTVDVPSEDFQRALEDLRGLGREVTTDAVQGQDVTEEFVDLESRERNLLAAEESLLRLYDDAEDVRAALEIQRELTIVRGDIEVIQGRLNYIERRTETSRISVSIQPYSGAAESRAGWDPASAVASAWGASLSVLQTAATVAISALVFSWWLAPVPVVAFVWWRRRNREPTAES